MPHVPKSVRKSSLLLAVYYAVVSACIILFGSPLFRVLSFEYSALIALFGSLPVMWFAARYGQYHKEQRAIKMLVTILLSLIPAILVPVIISFIFVRSCDTIYGLGYYIKIVLPSTIVGIIFGGFCGSWAKTKRAFIFSVFFIWVFTFLISLFPGYLSQRIFTYGWQYGYFPGFVWDEYIEFDYTAMLMYLLPASAALAAVKPKVDRGSFWKSLEASHGNLFYIAGVLVLLIGSILSGNLLNPLTHNEVEKILPEEFTVGSVTVHHTEYVGEVQAVLQFEIEQYLKEITAVYPSVDPSLKVDVYLYPITGFLYHYVGTRRASIAKPWLGTLHIAEENLSSLKHELVHLLLKPHGNFPIYASWSTGLTEGAAVASEDDYDGLRTVDELSAWALSMQYATGVSAVMKFTGFASTASSASYILTGSFSKYLLAKYGSEKYLSLYHTRDYEAIYGESLDGLDAEWKNVLLRGQHPMNASDSVLAQYYFDRPSIVNQACLRRIGRLIHEAKEAYSAERYAEAYELYHQAYSEDSTRLDALRGMVLSKLKQFQFQAKHAAAILDSSSAMSTASGKVLLSSLRGDAHYLAFEDKNAMKVHYDDAIRYAANETRFVSAIGMRMLLEDTVFDVKKYLFYRYELELSEPYSPPTYENLGNKTKSDIPQALYEHTWESEMPDSIRVGYILLRTLYNESRGEYSAAIHEWQALPIFVDPNKLSPAVRKAYDIIERKVNLWVKALGL